MSSRGRKYPIRPVILHFSYWSMQTSHRIDTTSSALSFILPLRLDRLVKHVCGFQWKRLTSRLRDLSHCESRIVNMTCSLSFWLQMSEPITHIDTDNYMTIHHKGTSYFDSTAHLFSPLTEMISYHSL